MFKVKALLAASILVHFSSPALAFSYDDYDVIYSRDIEDLLDYDARDLEDWDIPLVARYHVMGSFKTGDLTPEQQKTHTSSLQTLMNEDFDRTRNQMMNGPNPATGEERKHWRTAKAPMMDTIHKPGTDGKLHYGSSSGNNANPPPHEKGTTKMMDACGGAGNHNSGGKCAEHTAADSFHKNNPLGSIKGANSFAMGETKADRKSGNPGARPQEACKGLNGKAGCEDHLKAAGIHDLVHEKGSQPGDDKKTNKNKPGGINRKESSHFAGGTLNSGTPKRKENPSTEAPPQKVPKNDEHNFPSLPSTKKTSAKTESPSKPSFADALKSDVKKDVKPAAVEKTGLKLLKGVAKKLIRRELQRMEMERRYHARGW